MWKPGQLVTVNRRIYRVKRSPDVRGIVRCSKMCAIWFDEKPQTLPKAERVCLRLCLVHHNRVPDYCYLERVKPKHT